MYQESDIKAMVKDVLTDILSNNGGGTAAVSAPSKPASGAVSTTVVEDGFCPDITAQSTKEQFFVPDPVDREGYMHMKEFTPARIGVWRAGYRYNTWSQLRFRADHATAQDAVFNDVGEELVEAQGWVSGQSQCHDRDEYVTRPDLGRKLDSDTAAKFKSQLQGGAKVTLMVGDGLSSAAIEANAADCIQAITQGLKRYSIDVGPIPFVKYCRVGAMDALGELIGSDVICLLVGERPGLVTAESMSAYICYQPNTTRPESWRTVVSNIHRGGTPAVEAGAHIADLLKRILDEKVSGVDLAL